VRTVARSLAQALAPVLFGGIADLVSNVQPKQTLIGTKPPPGSLGSATGLEISFLILLVTLGAAGWFMARARHRYAPDVAAAAASAEWAEADEATRAGAR
jgi:hypothetical protein